MAVLGTRYIFVKMDNTFKEPLNMFTTIVLELFIFAIEKQDGRYL